MHQVKIWAVIGCIFIMLISYIVSLILLVRQFKKYGKVVSFVPNLLFIVSCGIAPLLGEHLYRHGLFRFGDSLLGHSHEARFFMFYFVVFTLWIIPVRYITRCYCLPKDSDPNPYRNQQVNYKLNKPEAEEKELIS